MSIWIHLKSSQTKRSSPRLFLSRLILMSLCRRNGETLPFFCHLSQLQKHLHCFKASVHPCGDPGRSAWAMLGLRKEPCVVRDVSDVALGGCDATWQAQGLLWWLVVVPFNLINTAPVAETCYGHATKLGLPLLQAVANTQWKEFCGKSACQGVRWEISSSLYQRTM